MIGERSQADSRRSQKANGATRALAKGPEREGQWLAQSASTVMQTGRHDERPGPGFAILRRVVNIARPPEIRTRQGRPTRAGRAWPPTELAGGDSKRGKSPRGSSVVQGPGWLLSFCRGCSDTPAVDKPSGQLGAEPEGDLFRCGCPGGQTERCEALVKGLGSPSVVR